MPEEAARFRREFGAAPGGPPTTLAPCSLPVVGGKVRVPVRYDMKPVEQANR